MKIKPITLAFLFITLNMYLYVGFNYYRNQFQIIQIRLPSRQLHVQS